MMHMRKTSAKISTPLLASAAAAAIMQTAAAQDDAAARDDVIVVTAQRKAQSLRDVPISVTALGAEDIADRQIESFTDIQFNTPNLSFTKIQFTQSTISIRGIAQLASASTTTDSVSIHQNDIPQTSSRLFETEFFDIERIEVLRGPQGTLFGRNATGGVLNIHTARPSTDGVTASAEAQYGNFDHTKIQGHVNFPITETLAVRVAGMSLDRDGFTTNVFTGSKIDDRELYAVRGSVRWHPTDNTTVDVIASYFEEDDQRMSFQKTRCNAHPLLGCATGLIGTPGYETLGFDQPNVAGTFASIASVQTFSGLAAGINPALAPIGAAVGLFSTVDAMGNPIDLAAQQGLTQPTDLRRVALDVDPQYYADELFIAGNVLRDFENFSIKINGGYGVTTVNSIRDGDGGVGPTSPVPAFALFPGLGSFYADGLPTSAIGSNSGIISGDIFSTSNNLSAVEQSLNVDSKYWSLEGIISTDFDGPFNFLGGVIYTVNKSPNGADFNVSYNALDYFSAVGGTLIAVLNGNDPNNAYSFYAPTFANDTVDSTLKSISGFGEIYVDITDRLKFTGGVRYNNDKISTADRNAFLSSFASFLAGAPGVTPFAPIGTSADAIALLLDSDPATQGTAGAAADFEFTNLTFNAVTGRAVVQWEPVDGQHLYASWSRGFKPGGVNPPSTLDLVFPSVFADEIINAYEIGAKLTAMNGALRANLAAFSYDYKDLQVTNIIGLTAVNENFDARIFGLEGEFIVQPTDNFRINLNAAYLNTRLADGSISIDPANPTAGQDVDLFKETLLGISCVVNNNGMPSLIGQTFAGFGELSPYVPQCSTLESIVDGVNATLPPGGPQYQFSSSGLPISLGGNDLPQSPEYSVSVGAEYDFRIGDNYFLTPRIDYYYQGAFYASQFNRVADRVEGYGNMNLQLTFAPEDGPWYVRAFAQNVLDSDNVTGQFVHAQSLGSIVHQFIQEPRRWGGAIGVRF
jgi:outer membrane receptor protein involved in Fe transport